MRGLRHLNRFTVQNRKGENMKNIKEKFRSWPLWLALGSLAVFCAKEFAGIDIGDTVDRLLNVLLPVLVAFGVVNNPNDRTSI